MRRDWFCLNIVYNEPASDDSLVQKSFIIFVPGKG
jgi:hypothetical protein